MIRTENFIAEQGATGVKEFLEGATNQRSWRTNGQVIAEKLGV